jgi:outer membrane protein assembly factor BamB
VIALLQGAIILVPGWVVPGTMTQFMGKFYGPMIGALALVVWWLVGSRLQWVDRFLVLGAFAGAGVGAAFLADESFRFGLILYALPLATTAWVLWLVLTPWMSWPVRRAGLLAVIFVAACLSCTVRMDGATGSFSGEFALRWTTTAEERFLAEHKSAAGAPDEVVTLQEGDWPAFRGPKRDGRLEGVRIATAWANRPQQPVWKHRIGPGWSSFAVVGHRLYTQEQRGEVEAVVCYDANSGDELWAHDDNERFKETVSGAGPRATPTFHEGKVYALGAKGRLNCLDAATGRVVWTRNAAEDSGAGVPIWGFASSPLVWHGLVTVYTGAGGGHSVCAYDAEKGGEPVWMAGDGKAGYCSPHPATLGGVEQILIAADAGLEALHPTEGKVLWRHDWSTEQIPRCVQPAVTGEGTVLLGTGMTGGERCLEVSYTGDSWKEPAEVWTSKALKAYYNDRVVHKGHVYGFDGNMFTCISLADGKSRWRGGRYGNGQVLLLPDQDLLLVLSEKGEVVLVAADPEKHRELGRFQAIDGKTWNHPVIAHGKLFVRNGEEAACYELLPE